MKYTYFLKPQFSIASSNWYALHNIFQKLNKKNATHLLPRTVWISEPWFHVNNHINTSIFQIKYMLRKNMLFNNLNMMTDPIDDITLQKKFQYIAIPLGNNITSTTLTWFLLLKIILVFTQDRCFIECEGAKAFRKIYEKNENPNLFYFENLTGS